MDKHNKHHKNKDKGVSKPLPAQPASLAPPEPPNPKDVAATDLKAKSQASGGKRK